MRILTPDDIVDVYSKLHQRGLGFLLSKFNLTGIARTKSAFDNTAIQASNWWLVPKVRARWNRLITGDEQVNYKQYLVKEFLQNQSGLTLLSLGSGSCSHELELAGFSNFEKIICVDIAQNWLDDAAAKARQHNLTNIEFVCASIYDYPFPENHFDLVLFNSSLHHFKKVEELLGQKVKYTLKKNGKLIMNEYVGPNRLQFPHNQLESINKALQLIPEKYRSRFKTHSIKSAYHGSGLLRMVLADPSECIESQNIVPALHRHFEVLVERPYGGNILMAVLKDIAHHFVMPDAEQEEILNQLFLFEDEYLKHHASDFVFGLYEKKE